MMTEGTWAFGYGSNMNLEHLSKKKGVTVLEHIPAILKGFKLGFFGGWALVEPGFGGLYQDGQSELHGLAYRVSKADMDRIDRFVSIWSIITNNCCSYSIYDLD